MGYVENESSVFLLLFLQRFKSGQVKVLMLSLAHAAAGTNLQMANHVILVEPAGHNKSHGAAIEAQAVGRCVRLGQTQVVTGACSASICSPGLASAFGVNPADPHGQSSCITPALVLASSLADGLLRIVQRSVLR